MYKYYGNGREAWVVLDLECLWVRRQIISLLVHDTVKIFPLYCIGPMSMMDLIQLKVPILEYQEIYIENVMLGKKKLE